MSTNANAVQIINEDTTGTELFGPPVSFAAGPTKVPAEVKKRIMLEFFNFAGSNLSILEVFHRSKEFLDLIKKCEDNLRKLLQIPSNYQVLFLQGGGSGQFAAIPMNLLGGSKKSADYLATCKWSEKAFNEAKKYGTVRHACPRFTGNADLPNEEDFECDPDAAYFYYCDNDTIGGLEFSEPPRVPAGVPIVCDMSSNFLSKPVDVSKYGVIFTGTQKNLGCAGCAIVIVRNDLLDQSMTCCPSILNYRIQATAGSIFNTPAVFTIYVCNLICEWILAEGGLVEMDKKCKQRSNIIYNVMETSNGFYKPLEAKKNRSRVNLVMRLGNPKLENLWLAESTANGLLNMKGHRSVGGVRISMYNAISPEDVNRLRDFMLRFQQEHQKNE